MAVSKTAVALTFIGAILSLVGAFFNTLFGLFALGRSPIGKYVVFVAVGFVAGVLLLVAADNMKKEATAKKWSAVAFWVSLLVGLNIIGLIGAIMGIVAAAKKTSNKT